MDADGLPLIGAGIDFSKVEPIPHKRSIACINHFVMHTVSFLNRFSNVCEEKLEDLAIRIQRLETTMNILESKLSSIPGIDGVTIATTTAQPQLQPSTATAQQNSKSYTEGADSSSNVNASANSVSVANGLASPATETITNGDTPNQQTTVSASSDPRYAKFFNLLKIGVPKAALAPKLLLEGLDPAVLDNPSGPVPSAAPVPVPAKSDDKNDSDFSDSDNTSDSLSDSQSSEVDLDD